MTRFVIILLLAAQAAAAQGVLTGHVFDAAGGEQYLDEAGMIAAVPLPKDAPPFNEITSTEWQEAFSALAEGRVPETPLGGALAPVEITDEVLSAELQGDGTFRLEGIPFERRMAVAVKIGEWWWPLREELWFDTQGAAMEVQIPYYRLGADRSAVRIERWRMDASGTVRQDLKYAPVSVVEALTITNPDPNLAAMVTISLDILVSPGISARSLPSQYGSELLYMQGWNAAEPLSKPGMTTGAWTFGTGGGMHGGAPVRQPGAQLSADNWHQLNSDPMLAMVGAGDTSFRVNPSPSGRSATLVFTRPIPPARDGAAGALTIRLAHRGGVLMVSPSDKLSIKRSFDYAVVESTAQITEGLTLAALVEGAHRRLYAQPQGGTYAGNPDETPDLPAGEIAVLALGFNREAQEFMRDFEARASGETPPTTPEETPKEKQMDVSVIFKTLAFVFGLAFVGALIATVRKPRDEQLKRLAELPASRQEVLEAITKLEQEYKKGALPPRAYSEQRQRLLNRLVEFDARAKEKDD